MSDVAARQLTPFTGKGGRKEKGKKGGKKGEEDDDGRWRQEWNNTVVFADPDDARRHWRREARCFGLAELFHQFRDRYTAKQLYRFFTSCRILVHKRVHGKSAPERRAAAQMRYQTTGRYGFGP